ncbi:MAG TPA: 2-dehydropantoate 2-reductase [Candidatus Angelobacter sp.]|nr:2-dehydropantoate 2-reductase [Candidatus Angelobacter sp.]
MRILVVGAGAIGGYFGGRLLEAGQDVTFLVRPRRAAELASSGLVIRSRFGDVAISAPPTVVAEDLRQHFDVVLLSTKAYDLESAIASFAPAVGPQTAILPLLNGMRHLDVLSERFGKERVLGGQCLIAATLNQNREIVHLNESHDLSFGELNGSCTPRVEAIAMAMSRARFQSRLSQSTLSEMWAKWVFIATAAGITCLMRAAVGDIINAGGSDLGLSLSEECVDIARQEGFPLAPASLERGRSMLTQPGSTLTASMLRDIEQRSPIEADQIVGDLLSRGQKHGLETPLLRVAYVHLKSYEARRAREAKPVGAAA